MKAGNQLISTGIITAVLASLCCITPLLALLAGASGLAANSAWLEPFRPYFIGLTILVLGFSWYQKLRPKTKGPDCACEDHKDSSFWQSKRFLVLLSLLVILLLGFPFYAHTLYPSAEKKPAFVQQKSSQQIEYAIQGMTCQGCEAHVEHEVNQLPGILEVKAHYAEGNARISFDPTQLSPEEIESAINKTGYKALKKDHHSQQK